MKRKLMLLMTCLFIGIGLVNAQISKVTGTVISEEDGLPVVGASIVVKGTTLGTVTDMDGKFTLTNIPSSAETLMVSFIGMKTQEVAIKPTVNVLLKPDTEVLEEVMVVAYGTAKKSAFTGSAAVVNAEDIGKVQASNAVTALTGKVSGVQLNTVSGQPGQTSPTIRIRGISSINAGNAPLIILDGAPYDGDMNNINSQDIESMTVLKDAASNALYGARGANGVIMITTKKGKSGAARVTLDAKWGSNSRATQDYDYIKSPAQYYELHYASLRNYFTNEMGYDAAAAHAAANQNLTASNGYGLNYNVYTVPEGQYMIGENGKLNPNATLGRLVTYKGQDYWLQPDDYMDEAYNNSLRQEYNMTISAGTEKSSFYTSLNYLGNEGITANSDYKRLSARLKADYQVKDWMKVGANMSYTNYEAHAIGEDGNSGSSGNIFAYATGIAPIYPLYIRDGQGNIMLDGNGFKRYDYGDKENAGLERPFLPGGNPYSSNLLDTNHYDGNAFNANGFMEIRFLKDFKFTWTSGVYLNESRSTYVTNPYYGSYASSNGIVDKYHARDLSYNHQQLLNWSKEFGFHNVQVMLGHESYRSKYYYLYGGKTNMFDPNNSELNGAVTDNGASSYTTDYNTEGYFGRVMYDYAEKYHLSASFRRDASSRFHPDNRWGNFWSAGAAWVISKEDFFNVDWVNMLKLKASYGEQGNDAIGNYRYTNTFDVVNSSGNPATVPSTMGNKDITWETNANFNAGVEFEILNSRIKGGIEYFYRKTSDMLFSFPLPPSYGYTSYYANVGDMRNQGVELELTFTPIETKDFTWDINFNMTHYKNKITYLPEERKTATAEGYKGYQSGSYFYGEGLSLYTLYYKKYAGVAEDGQALYYYEEPKKDDQGNAMKDANGNPITERKTTTDYSSASYYLCDTTLPDLYGGFSTSFTYKGFDLAVDFAYQIGGQVYDSGYASLMGSPTSNSKGYGFHADILDAWTPENSTSNIPRLQYGDEYTAAGDRFITDASYLSLQNINLGYTFPSSWTRKFGLEKLRIYGAADNIWVWSKRQGLDPRQSITGGVNNQYYAPIRTISGGITLTF